MNCDEAVLSVVGKRLQLKRISAANRKRMNAELLKPSSLGSMITFMQASGKIFILVYISKSKFSQGGESEIPFEVSKNLWHLSASLRRYYAWNDTGRLNAEVFSEIMKARKESWKRQCPSLNCLVFGDKFSAHKCVEVIEKMLREYIHVFLAGKRLSFFSTARFISFWGAEETACRDI